MPAWVWENDCIVHRLKRCYVHKYHSQSISSLKEADGDAGGDMGRNRCCGFWYGFTWRRNFIISCRVLPKRDLAFSSGGGTCISMQ